MASYKPYKRPHIIYEMWMKKTVAEQTIIEAHVTSYFSYSKWRHILNRPDKDIPMLDAEVIAEAFSTPEQVVAPLDFYPKVKAKKPGSVKNRLVKSSG